jgi:hypothetical protein
MRKSEYAAINEGGLSGHDIRMIFFTAGCVAASAAGKFFFDWHQADFRMLWGLWLLFGLWGYGCEFADDTKDRLRRLDGKLDDLMEVLSDLENIMNEVCEGSTGGSERGDRKIRFPLDIATETEIDRAVRIAKEEIGATTLSSMGAVIKRARELLKGKQFEETELSAKARNILR